jgi:hypothetical protein
MNTKKWKDYKLNEEERKQGTIEIGYETDAALIYDKTIRPQKYCLNSIREIEGVRIVNVTSPVDQLPSGQLVGVRLKFTPVKKAEITTFTSFLRGEILSIKGVVSIRFLKTVKANL